MDKKGNGKKRITFKLDVPEAAHVSVAGNFNDWDIDSHPLRMNGKKGSPEGAWQKAMYLEPGTYEYRFIVDGIWCDDPGCTQFSDNNFGSRNGLIRVS